MKLTDLVFADVLQSLSRESGDGDVFLSGKDYEYWADSFSSYNIEHELGFKETRYDNMVVFEREPEEGIVFERDISDFYIPDTDIRLDE